MQKVLLIIAFLFLNFISTIELSAQIISSFSPSKAPIGAQIIIEGSGFNPSGPNDVYFGSVKVTVNANVAGTQIIVNVPAGASSVAPIVVKNNTTGLQASSITSSTPFFTKINTPALPSLNYEVTDFTSGSNPETVAAADFNGDNIADLAVSNTLGDELAIFNGNASGGFATPTIYNTPGIPSSVKTGDFDGDGHIDIVLINRGSNNFSVFTNDGSGAFPTSANVALSASPREVTPGDLNGDGNLDLAFLYGDATGNVGISLNDGSGSFPSPTNSDMDVASSSLVTGDFNSDGDLDLASQNFGSRDVVIMLGDGLGGITPQVVSVGTVADPETRRLVSGDFDGQNGTDIAVLTYDFSSPSDVRILLSDGIGGFTGPANYPVGQRPEGIAIGDFDGDGNTDLAVANFFDNDISILLGDGAGDFSNRQDIATDAGPQGIAVSDFNKDGQADIVTSNRSSGTVSAVLYQALPPVINSFTPSSAPIGTEITIEGSGFNLSGPNDVYFGPVKVVGNANATGTQMVVNVPAGASSVGPLIVKNNTTGLQASSLKSTTPYFNLTHTPALSITTDSYTQTSFATASSFQTIASGDFDNDGYADIATGSGSSAGVRTIELFKNNRYGAFPTSFPTLTLSDGGFVSGLEAGDLDGDGNLDIVVAKSTTGDLNLFKGNGDGTFTNFPTIAGVTGAGGGLALEDINNDGYIDVITAGGGALNILIGDGTGNFTAASGSPKSLSPILNSRNVSMADLNNDKYLDIVIPSFIGGNSVLVLLNNQDETFADAVLYTTGNSPWRAITGDYDGDGNIDIAALSYESDNITILKGDGTGSFSPFPASPVGIPAGGSRGLEQGDFDGDGIIDLVVGGYDNNQVALLKGDGSGDFASFSTFPFDMGTGQPWGLLAEDLNNDGVADITIADWGNNKFDVLLSPPSFITTWVTTNGQITIPTTGTGYNYDIVWTNLSTSGLGNGAVTNQTGNYTISGLTNGDTYQVLIRGQFPRIYFNNSSDRTKIRTIEQWGDNVWESMENAFYGCTNLTYSATDAPNLSMVTTMSGMFQDAHLFNGDLNSWDVSTITNMENTFSRAFAFNGDISDWQVGNVTSMQSTFNLARAFNQDLSLWDVTNVTDMSYMFYGTENFNSNIGGWETGNVSTMRSMFRFAEAFDQNINGWDVSSVTDMMSMFAATLQFNQNLDNWDVSNVQLLNNMFEVADKFNGSLEGWDISSATNVNSLFARAKAFNGDVSGWTGINVTSLSRMFDRAESFNGDLSSWDVSAVTDMSYMFAGADAFNGDISNWNVENLENAFRMFQSANAFNIDIGGWQPFSLTNMRGMFNAATSFNQDLSSWDVTNVTDMDAAFLGASSFNQNLGSWDIGNVTDMSGMLNNTDLSTENYDDTLIGWAQLSGSESAIPQSLDLFGAGLTYCTAKEQRQELIDTHGWIINSDSYLCSAPAIQSTTISFSNITSTQMDISWTSGDGQFNLVLVREGSMVDAMPANGLAYTADNTLGSGDEIGTGNFVVYNGTGDTFTLTNLVAGTEYHIQVFAYNGTEGAEIYNVSDGLADNPSSILLAPEINLFDGADNTATPILDAQTTAIDFNTTTKNVDVSRTFSVQNTGTIPLNISGITVSGTAYSVSNSISAIAAGNTEAFTITLSASIAGQFDETLTISCNDTDENPFTFALTGTVTAAPEIQVLNGATDLAMNETIDFGSLEETASTAQTLTISNTGTADLNISDIQLTTGTAYSISDIALPATIPTGSSTTVTITLSSTTAQTWNDILTITSDDSDEATFTLNLTGEVNATQAPELQVLNGAADLAINDEIDFGNIVENTSTSQTLTISNTGTADLNISDIQLTTGTVYSISDIALPATIVAGSTADFVVTFASATAQAWTDALTITSDDADEGSFTLNLIGEVTPTPAPEIQVLNGAADLAINDEIDFGNIQENTSASQIFTISNSGTADLIVSNIQLVTGTAYSISGITLPATITAGNTADFVVTLASATAQNWTDILTITSDDADESSFTLNLTGTVTSANGQEITVNYNGNPLISGTGTIAFGDVTQTQEISETFTIENTGTNDLIIMEIILSDGSVFTLEGLDFPIMLLPGETLDITIFLNTDNLGSFTDTITIVTNDPDLSGFEVNLSGNVSAIPQPQIQVQRQAAAVNGVVELGTVETGENLEVAFDILNMGNADLQVANISSSNARFTVSAITLPSTIPASATRSFNLAMTTDQTGIYESTITVSSNDPEQNLYTFEVRGIVEGARVVIVITNSDNSTDRIEISGEDINLGQTPFNVNIEKKFGIENLSDSEEIFVNSITSDNPLFKISNIPNQIAAGDWKEFSVILDSKSIGLNSGKITVSTSLNDFSFNVVAEVISEEEPELIPYNLVTPNGDGKHDLFFIENISLFPNNTVSIFNRLGNKVFELSNYDNTTQIFEGISSSGQELITGNYYYVIDKGDGSKRISGFLLIKR